MVGALGVAAVLAALGGPVREPPPQVVVQVVAPRPPPPPPPAVVEGFVLPEGGGPGLPFTVVRIQVPRRRALLALTNAEGRFRIAARPPPGRYPVDVIDEGWEGRAEVEIPEDGAVALVVRARPAP